MKNARFGNGLSLVLVLVLATLVAGVFARRASIRLATEFHGNYSGFIQLGRERFDENPLVRDRPDIKRSVLLVDGDGYDGQFMYYMTFDPFMRRFDSYREMSRWLLKLSGGSVDDYATCSASFPTRPSC